MLENFEPINDATVMQKLQGAGAVMLGKTNMDEFAMGSSTENSAYHRRTIPGTSSGCPVASSGGSAAAVAALEALDHSARDTGGSIRQPALAIAASSGMKPTYGRVSRFGLVAFASSLDQIGPFTRSVADAALLLRTISGHDPLDSTSLDEPVPDYIPSWRRA